MERGGFSEEKSFLVLSLSQILDFEGFGVDICSNQEIPQVWRSAKSWHNSQLVKGLSVRLLPRMSQLYWTVSNRMLSVGSKVVTKGNTFLSSVFSLRLSVKRVSLSSLLALRAASSMRGRG